MKKESNLFEKKLVSLERRNENDDAKKRKKWVFVTLFEVGGLGVD